MTAIVFLVEQLSAGLYILFGIGILRYSWRLITSRREYRATQFELERELSRYKQANALMAIVLLVEFAAIVFGIQYQVVPVVRERFDMAETISVSVDDGILATPTVMPLVTSVGFDPAGPLGEDDPGLAVFATPTLTPTPVGTIEPNPPPSIGCDTDNATLQMPANGMRVFQPIPVRGTAYTDDFAGYKIEIMGASTFDIFHVVDDKRSPVYEVSELSQFIPSPYEPGWYQFRLVVFDITATMRASCMVNILISEPIPTPTPIGQ